ncbi:OLC1v1023961C1 [Oldenlandia corymbosa var. corymbosa]|uniref:OLC1v1023961C1 n=1 Tax=Oldenlandia corymbosa var. corymbosa TaxID=529605 RepID=A0AAV1C1E0_OLDCO|nr:OLC1v1023961C1 [Oldenlandia corymbosa var. corymbosa]
MAEEQIIGEQPPTPNSIPSTSSSSDHQNSANASSMILLRIMSKRRTWVCLFVGVYTVLLSLSWNFLKSVLSWYESTLIDSSSSSGSVYSGWSALYASVVLGVAFGILSMVAALAVAVPATLVTWITVLVLLTFFGKPRRALVTEGKKLTADITGFVVKVLIKEGNIVAALCAVLGYFVFVRNSRDNNTGSLGSD